MSLDQQIIADLEGKYIVTKIDSNENDFRHPGHTYSIDQYVGGKIDSIIDGCLLFSTEEMVSGFYDDAGNHWDANEWIISEMKKLGIKEVIEIYSDEKLEGIDYGSHKISEGHSIYVSPFFDPDFFEKNGIEVKYFDLD